MLPGDAQWVGWRGSGAEVSWNSRELLKFPIRDAENSVMMSHEIFEYDSRRTPRRTLRFAPFVVLVALAAYATIVVAALTAPDSAESGSSAGDRAPVTSPHR